MNPIVEVLITVSLAENQLARLRELSPRLRINYHPTKKASDVPGDVWNRVEVLYTDGALPDPNQAPHLKWIQFHYAGIDAISNSPILRKPDLTATTLSGAATPQMGEYVVMMLLALGHKLPELFASQSRSEWPRDRFERFTPRELRGSTVGIVGYGSVGRQVAYLLQPFRVTILAAKHDVMHPEDSDYRLEGMGDPNGDLFQRLYPIQALPTMLRDCDFVVVSIPLTPETRGLIGKNEFEAIKPGAFLIDISRGGIVDSQALIQALQDKKLGGAALDVFAEEPLPANSSLWKMPNVIITPHISGNSPFYTDRAVALFAENLERYLTGLPLYNRFDPQRGY
jgi:phosphoglycerate dehydrogenase-like enzyme